MKTWQIIVGSTRRPKLDAVKAAAASIAPLLGEDAVLNIQGREVESGVNHTPTSRGELMRGARQRTEALQQQLSAGGTAFDFIIGLEGGLDVVAENGQRKIFLESWAYVSNGATGHFGCSGSIELPEPLAEEVLTRGTELSVAIDRFAGQVGIRDGQGAWGVPPATSSLVRNPSASRWLRHSRLSTMRKCTVPPPPRRCDAHWETQP